MYSKDDSIGLPHGFRLDNLSLPDACKSQNWFCAHAISAFLQGLFEVINEKRQSWHLGLRAYWEAFGTSAGSIIIQNMRSWPAEALSV